LEVIEVQLGEYLEEDDIVRIKDDFGRTDMSEPLSSFKEIAAVKEENKDN